MKPMLTLLAVIIALAIALPTMAGIETPPAAANDEGPALTAPSLDVPAATQSAVSVCDAFGEALAKGDFKAVEAMLAPAVIILESGGAEHTRSEYLAHHAKSDAAFLAGTRSQLTRRTARVDGNTAWVASESELHASKDGKPLTLLSTETMVLAKAGNDWRIVHIHWSSRPKRTS